MSKKNIVILAVVCASILFLITGCLGGGQFGAPGTGTATIKGWIAMPQNACYADYQNNSAITEGIPLSNATVILKGSNGNDLFTTTDAQGNYQVTGAKDSCYILYANKANTNIWVKQGISPVTQGQTKDAGEANAYTTAQVIIYEVAVGLYNIDGKVIVKCSDVPNLLPSVELVNAVKAVLANCKDAQQDSNVAALATALARTTFGAPAPETVPVTIIGALLAIPDDAPKPTAENPAILINAKVCWMMKGDGIGSKGDWNDVLVMAKVDDTSKVGFTYEIIVKQGADSNFGLLPWWPASEDPVGPESITQTGTVTWNTEGTGIVDTPNTLIVEVTGTGTGNAPDLAGKYAIGFWTLTGPTQLTYVGIYDIDEAGDNILNPAPDVPSTATITIKSDADVNADGTDETTTTDNSDASQTMDNDAGTSCNGDFCNVGDIINYVGTQYATPTPAPQP